MSSHDIFRAKTIADRVGIMRNGKLIEILDKEAVKKADLQEIYLECMEEISAGHTSVKVEA